MDADQTDDPSAILSLFPGVNFIRLAVGNWNGGTLDSVRGFVDAMTSNDVVVEIEDHPWNGGDSPQPQAYSGDQLAAESAVYAQLAAAFANNPYVWFGTMNEPQPGGDVAAQQVATYNAIRGAGNPTILMMEAGAGGGNPGAVGAGALPAGDYASMHNVVWDLHHYGWTSHFSTDQDTVNNSLMGSASAGQGVLATRTIQSADGVIPVIVGEFGPACCGSDANGDEVINSVMWAAQNDAIRGFAGWEWLVEGEDSLTNGGQSLTNWGKILSMAIASSCQQLSPGIAANAATPATTQAPAGSSGSGGSALAVSLPAGPAPSASPLVDDGSVPGTAPADTDQSFQQGTQDATSTISAAASAVDAAAKARMQ
jgi:hypothetical protein